MFPILYGTMTTWQCFWATDSTDKEKMTNLVLSFSSKFLKDVLDQWFSKQSDDPYTGVA